MVLRQLARPLLASWFVYSGVQAVLAPEKRAKSVAPQLDPVLADMGVPELKTDDIIKAHGAATVGAAVSLALSRTPRTSAMVLALLSAGTLSVDTPFWEEKDPVRRREQLESFLKSAALVGGVLIAATAGHSARHNAHAKAKKAKRKGKSAPTPTAKIAKAQRKASSELKKYFK